MARILYGLCGVGRGHTSRGNVIINRLLDSGHEVRIVTWGNGHELLPRYFNIDTIDGWNFSLNSNGLDYFHTAVNGAAYFAGKSLKTWKKVCEIIDEFNPHVAISDFEPYVSAGCNIKNIPLISLDHSHIISACQIECPENWAAQYGINDRFCRMVAMNARHFFITSFYFPGLKESFKHKTTLTGPVLRPEILCREPDDRNHLLVYISNSCIRNDLLPILQNLDIEVIAYGFYDYAGRKGNITFKEPSFNEFIDDLAGSTAVIANAGYNLICESLYLGKPVYSIPINGQFEQMANAYYLQKNQYGIYDFHPDKQRLNTFINNILMYRRNIAVNQNSYNANNTLMIMLEDRITKLIKDNLIKNRYRRQTNWLPGIARSLLNDG